jgi:hypothetical protein
MCAPVVRRGPDELFRAVDQRRGASSTMVTRVRERSVAPAAAAKSATASYSASTPGGVADEHADPDRAGGEVGRDLVEDPRHLCRGRSLLPSCRQPAKIGGSAPVERPSATTCMRAAAHDAEKP